MKIGIVIRCCRSHGSSRYALEVMKEFADAGHEVHIFTNNWDDELDKRVIIHKVPVISNIFYLCEASFQLFSTIMMKFHKFDVTMAQSTRYFTPDVAYMQFVYRHWANCKKKSGTPISPANRYLSWMEGRNTRHAKKIIAMSNIVKEEIMSNYNIPEDRIRVIYSGVDLDKFNPNKKKTVGKDVRGNLGLDSDDVVMVFAGNPYARKGLEYAVKALALIPNKNVKLLVMGKDLGNDKIENYKNLAERIGVSSRLIYGGFTREIEKYYAAGDIFLFPTLYEPFGLVILEALASGLPAVVSKSAGAAELIEDGKEGILLKTPKDEKEIAKTINSMLKNDAYREYGRNARLKAEKYPWSRLAKGMLEVFEEVKMRKKAPLN